MATGDKSKKDPPKDGQVLFDGFVMFCCLVGDGPSVWLEMMSKDV